MLFLLLQRFILILGQSVCCFCCCNASYLYWRKGCVTSAAVALHTCIGAKCMLFLLLQRFILILAQSVCYFCCCNTSYLYWRSVCYLCCCNVSYLYWRKVFVISNAVTLNSYIGAKCLLFLLLQRFIPK